VKLNDSEGVDVEEEKRDRQGRRQKNFQGGPMEKKRPRNCPNKPPFTLSVAGKGAYWAYPGSPQRDTNATSKSQTQNFT